ncbi:MAG: aspartate carbamoyltransferase [Defluviicoccus sp.]|nr:aspartate carbamoyltransferase [Defluviicoccus sp.]MDE0384951.1 aspartate carbamoyltransferase [Defluviicoccus sp.]
MLRHVVTVRDFTPGFLESVFQSAAASKRQHAGRGRGAKVRWSPHWNALRDHVMVSLFYEASTRTRHSFEAAMARLGGKVITTENAAEFSSAIKGESLEDTIRIESGYGDVIVLRHKEKGAAARAAAVSDVPVINAGDGDGEHPTQALLDLFTIAEGFPGRRDLRVTFVGDLLKGRTVHSLAYLAAMLEGSPAEFAGAVDFVAPGAMQIPRSIEALVRDCGLPVAMHDALTPALVAASDVIYMTRTQSERHEVASGGEAYALTERLAASLRGDAVVLHPLPRNRELPEAIDRLPQARYFEQARNGLFVRMAILLWVFGLLEPIAAPAHRGRERAYA